MLPEHKGEEDPEHGTTRQQEMTTIKAKGCDWHVYIAYKSVIRGGGNKTWVLGVANQEHAHDMTPNPLTYEIHQQRQPEHAKAILLARTHRLSQTTYKDSMRILGNTSKEPDEVLHLKKKKYYNLVPSITRSREDILGGLEQCLDDTNFTAKKRYMYVRNEFGVPVKRVLQQIVIIDNYQKTLAKRFASDFMMQNDATFNTNSTKLLLFVAVGITNTNQTFPAAFSFSTQESELSFNFFFETLKEEIWNDCNPPKVNISDQGKGLIASLPLMLPNCQLQHCNWHAVENIKARTNKSRRGYSKEKREDIHDATWAWIQSPDTEFLEKNRARLLELLYEDDQQYFCTYWFPKESQVVTCYTKNYRNLGCSSTQRNEGMHPILKAVMNPQATLENAVMAMQAKLKLWYKQIRTEVDKSRLDRPRTLDFLAFQILIGKITLYAINMVNPEWISAKQLVEESNVEGYEPVYGPCNCNLLVRYLLPCKHVLFRAADEGFPIPLSLFHPRWWINDVPSPREFTPRYYDKTLDPHDQDPSIFRDKGKNKYLEAAAQLEELHTKLPRQQADQLANQLVTFQVNVTSSHEAIQRNLQSIPTELPVPPPTKKSAWAALQEKKKHDKANARKLTAAEASEREAKKRDKQRQQEQPVYQAPPPPRTIAPSIWEPPSSSAPPKMTRIGRQVKEKKVWEQEKGLSQPRQPRGLTTETDLTVEEQRPKKKLKQNLVPTEDIDERESQQRRILGAAYVVED